MRQSDKFRLSGIAIDGEGPKEQPIRVTPIPEMTGDLRADAIIALTTRNAIEAAAREGDGAQQEQEVAAKQEEGVQSEGAQNTGVRRGPAGNKRAFDRGWEEIFGKRN